MTINEKVEYIRAIKELMESDLTICTTIGKELKQIIEKERYEKLPSLFTKISCYLIHFERQNQSKVKQ